jgi:ribosome-interacting GTPase 1
MPHRTYKQVIKRRLVGKEGAERARELRAILTELANFRNGPYADLRKWVNAEIELSRRRRGVVHRETFAVRREGVARIALVGPPNAGKSSLLQALSSIQIKAGDYAFTTTRPVPALTRIHDVLIQLVEIPGLITGAAEGRGGGRALLGVLCGADAIVYCHAVDAPRAELEAVRREVAAAGIEKRAVIAATKWDKAPPFVNPELEVVAVSVLDDDSLERWREAIWRLTDLVRVFLPDGEAVALHPPATVLDVAGHVHKEFAASSTGARIWGPRRASTANGSAAAISSPTATSLRCCAADPSSLERFLSASPQRPS